VGIDPSKVVVTKIKLDKDRKEMLKRKDSKGSAKKGKYSSEEMADVD
jgi:large subunit ribosomal protein L26e